MVLVLGWVVLGDHRSIDGVFGGGGDNLWGMDSWRGGRAQCALDDLMVRTTKYVGMARGGRRVISASPVERQRQPQDLVSSQSCLSHTSFSYSTATSTTTLLASTLMRRCFDRGAINVTTTIL